MNRTATRLWCCLRCTPCKVACLVCMPLLAHLLPLLRLLLLVVYCQKQAIWVSPLSGLHSALPQINPPDSFTTLLITYGARDAAVAEKKCGSEQMNFVCSRSHSCPIWWNLFIYHLFIFSKSTSVVSFFRHPPAIKSCQVESCHFCTPTPSYLTHVGWKAKYK